MWLVSEPPRGPRPANATIEIDKSDLDEILNATPGAASVEASLPPPLPPEEIARAQSLAPTQPPMRSMPSQGGPPETKPSLVPYIVISVALMILAGVVAGAVLYLHRARIEAATPVASASVVAKAETPASASPSSAPSGTTLTIHTVELGGKSGE